VRDFFLFVFFFGQPGWAWRRPMRERGDKKGGRLLATATTTLVFSCSHWVPIGPKTSIKTFPNVLCAGGLLSNNLF